MEPGPEVLTSFIRVRSSGQRAGSVAFTAYDFGTALLTSPGALRLVTYVPDIFNGIVVPVSSACWTEAPGANGGVEVVSGRVMELVALLILCCLWQGLVKPHLECCTEFKRPWHPGDKEAQRR